MKVVLFVCVHNAGRSQMAEAMLNHLAAQQGLPVRAESAGTAAGKQLNPIAVQAMQEIGIDISGQTPKILDQAMADRADRIITMGCGVDAEACPARILVSDDWGLEDPNGQEIEAVREIRQQIGEKIESLLDELTKNPR